MSISPAQMMLQVASAESPPPAGRSTQAAVPAGISTSVPTATPAVESQSPAPAPAALSPPQFSTDREVDSQHQVYYEFVDKSTGDVVFEIPPEALREIGESLNLPLNGETNGYSVDETS